MHIYLILQITKSKLPLLEKRFADNYAWDILVYNLMI